MADAPDLPSISRQITGLERRVTDLERARQADRLDRKQSGDRIETALAVMGTKVDGLLDIVIQFRGIARFLRIAAGSEPLRPPPPPSSSRFTRSGRDRSE